MQYSTLTILLIDENPGGAQALQKLLSPVRDMQFKLAHAQQLGKGLRWLGWAPIDLVLLTMPSGDDGTLEALQQMRTVAPRIPAIVLADFIGFDADMRILQRGAQDVVVRAEMTAPSLVRSMRYALARQAQAAPELAAAEPLMVDAGEAVEVPGSPPAQDAEPVDTTAPDSATTAALEKPASETTHDDVAPVTEEVRPGEPQAPLQPAEPEPGASPAPLETSGPLPAGNPEPSTFPASGEELPAAAARPPPTASTPATAAATSSFVFPTSDTLSERKEEEREPTAPKALSDTVEKDYKNLVGMAERIFKAANKGEELDSASVIDAILRTLEQLRKNDELLEESVRQQRDCHSWAQRGANVAVLSIRLGLEVKCDERHCLALGLCGLMHDLGMLTISQDVLGSSHLNSRQLQLLRQHPLESQRMIEAFGEAFAWVGKIVAQAHERQDGSGYPQGLKGDQIHKVARILGLADTYEAMSHPRPDRNARATYDALKEIVDRRNEQFDRRIIKALIDIVSVFPLGSLVQLSNGEIGRVVRVSRNFPTRPSVEIILDPQGSMVNYTRFVVLESEPLLTILDPSIPEDVLRR